MNGSRKDSAKPGRPELSVKAHEIDTVQDAVRITIHGSRGADGHPLPVKAIAEDVGHGTASWKLYQAADGDRKLSCEELPALIRATNNPLILDVIARKVGRVTFPLPQGSAEFPQLAMLTAEGTASFGEFMTELARSLSDGRITHDEASRIEQEGMEHIAVLCHAIRQAKENASDGPLRVVAR